MSHICVWKCFILNAVVRPSPFWLVVRYTCTQTIGIQLNLQLKAFIHNPLEFQWTNKWMNEWVKERKKNHVILILSQVLLWINFFKTNEINKTKKTIRHTRETRQNQCLPCTVHMIRSLLLICNSYRFCVYSTVNIICDYRVACCCCCFNFHFFLLFFKIQIRICLYKTVFFWVCVYVGGAFNIFLIVFHLVFTSVPHTCSMCSELHAHIAAIALSPFCTCSLSAPVSFSIYFVTSSHPRPRLTLAVSLSLSLYLCFLFLPYFNDFIADFKASNTDTQPYQIPHKIITIIIGTQFIYIYSIVYT